MPELRQLRYFTAIVDAGWLTRAAAKLYIAQPALSRQTAALEGELGIRPVLGAVVAQRESPAVRQRDRSGDPAQGLGRPSSMIALTQAADRVRTTILEVVKKMVKRGQWRGAILRC